MLPNDITIRHHVKPGDAGYIIYMHGFIYAQEYGYTSTFEAYVAKSFYDFLLSYDPSRDRLWLAEHKEEIVGCIGIVGQGERAKLRWFLLHPKYRGFGLGKYLLSEAIQFCRDKGYPSVFLDTTTDLTQAISMYERAGFVKSFAKENHSWREDITELEFEMDLSP